MNDWAKFKAITELLWEHRILYEHGVSGFQIQPGTKWNKGIEKEGIDDLELSFGFQFPFEYRSMLMSINGFDRPGVDCYDKEWIYSIKCYTYPDDISYVRGFITELNDNIKYVRLALRELNLSNSKIKGFIPIYSHRALVVLEDLTKTPVISAVYDDIVLYGSSLSNYWKTEFQLEDDF